VGLQGWFRGESYDRGKPGGSLDPALGGAVARFTCFLADIREKAAAIHFGLAWMCRSNPAFMLIVPGRGSGDFPRLGMIF